MPRRALRRTCCAGNHDDFYSRFRVVVDRDGRASDRFLRAVMRSIARDERVAEERAAEQAKMSPVVEGKIQVTGRIVSLKLHENDYGVREVMTVLDDRGFKLWGTQPRSLYSAKVDDRVTFMATVERSDRDETFGFFKRPTKAQVI